MDPIFSPLSHPFSKNLEHQSAPPRPPPSEYTNVFKINFNCPKLCSIILPFSWLSVHWENVRNNEMDWEPLFVVDVHRTEGRDRDREKYSGEREKYSGDRDKYSGEREKYSGDREKYSGEREKYSSDRDKYSNDRDKYSGRNDAGR